MAFRDEDPIRMPKRVKIDFTQEAFSPDEVSQEYELTTFGTYKRAQEKKASLEWHKKHEKADVIVVNQDGDVLYALYKSPLGDHNDMVDHLFKTLRAQRYLEGEA